MASGHVSRADRPNTWAHRPQLILISPLDESSASSANIVRADCGIVISPRIAKIGRDGSGLIVSEEPQERRQSRASRRRDAQRAAQHDVQKRNGLLLQIKFAMTQSHKWTRDRAKLIDPRFVRAPRESYLAEGYKADTLRPMVSRGIPDERHPTTP